MKRLFALSLAAILGLREWRATTHLREAGNAAQATVVERWREGRRWPN